MTSFKVRSVDLRCRSQFSTIIERVEGRMALTDVSELFII